MMSVTSIPRRLRGAAAFHAVRLRDTLASVLWEGLALCRQGRAKETARRLADARAPIVAVFHQGGIGNGLLLGPLLQNIRARWPGSIVHLMAYQGAEGEVLKAAGLVDRVHRIAPIGREVLRVAAEPFDVLLSAARTIEGDRVARRIPARLKVGFRHRIGWHARSRLGHDLAIDLAGTEHEAVANASLLNVLISDAPSAPRSVLPTDLIQGIAAAPERRTKPRIAVHAGCSQSSAWKRYPLERMADVCRTLHARYDAELVLIAGPDEQEEVIRLAGALGDVGRVLNAPARFLDLFHFLRECDCVLSNDSGIMHLAAAAGVPVVGIFGPTDAGLTGPWALADRQRVVAAPVACRPCYAIYSGSVTCTNSERLWCLRSLEVRAVVDAVGALLEGAGWSASPEVSLSGLG